MVNIGLMTIPYHREPIGSFMFPHIKALLTAKAARSALVAKKEFSKVLEMLEGEELLSTRYNATLTVKKQQHVDGNNEWNLKNGVLKDDFPSSCV